MPLNKLFLGHNLFVINPVYEFEVTEGVDSSVRVNPFQSGFTVRNEESSRKRRTFTIVFKTVKVGIMNDLERFYRNLSGPLEPFWFKPPIELVNGRYTQVVSDGSQKLEDFESDLLRAGDQSVLVRFTQPFSRTLFTPLLENSGLVLEEVFGEDEKGNYLHFDGLLYAQNAFVPDHLQDYFDFVVDDDFMIDFMIRGETIFHTTSASYAALNTKTLVFTINSNPYTVTFTAGATDAASVVAEINDQQGDAVEAQVFGTTEFKIKSIVDTGFFTVSGTAKAQLNLDAPIVKIISKHDGVDTGYYFQQDGVGDLTFFLESGGTGKTITADSDFHVFDGSWHYVAVVVDYDGNGQIYTEGAVSGSPTAIGSIGSLENAENFYFNEDSNADFSIKRAGIWSWNADLGQLPSDIATRIATFNSDLFRIDEDYESGLKALWSFNKADGVDIVNDHELILTNSPTFHDFENGIV